MSRGAVVISGYVLYVSLAFLTCQTAMASSLGLCVAICHHCQIQQQNKVLQFARPREQQNKIPTFAKYEEIMDQVG